jgi:hypothetical protein
MTQQLRQSLRTPVGSATAGSSGQRPMDGAGEVQGQANAGGMLASGDDVLVVADGKVGMPLVGAVRHRRLLRLSKARRRGLEGAN